MTDVQALVLAPPQPAPAALSTPRQHPGHSGHPLRPWPAEALGGLAWPGLGWPGLGCPGFTVRRLAGPAVDQPSPRVADHMSVVPAERGLVPQRLLDERTQ